MPLRPRYGTLYRRTGGWQLPEEHLTTATAMFREMDIRFWLQEAEVERREPTQAF